MSYRYTTKDCGKRSRVDEDSDDESDEKSSKNIFRYLMFYIFPSNVGDGRRRVLHNLIKKYGGNFTEVVTNHTTHVLVDESVSPGKICRSLGWTTFPSHINVVYINWLSACVRAEYCLRVSDFQVPNNHKQTFVISSANQISSKNSPDTHYIKPKSQNKGKHSKQSRSEVVEADMSNIESVEEEESSFDDGMYDGDTSCDDEWLYSVPSEVLNMIVPQSYTSSDQLNKLSIDTYNSDNLENTGTLKLRLYRHKSAGQGYEYSRYSTVNNESQNKPASSEFSESRKDIKEARHKSFLLQEKDISKKLIIPKADELVIDKFENPSVVLKDIITELKVPLDSGIISINVNKSPERKEIETVFVSEASSSLNIQTSTSEDLNQKDEIIANSKADTLHHSNNTNTSNMLIQCNELNFNNLQSDSSDLLISSKTKLLDNRKDLLKILNESVSPIVSSSSSNTNKNSEENSNDLKVLVNEKIFGKSDSNSITESKCSSDDMKVNSTEKVESLLNNKTSESVVSISILKEKSSIEKDMYETQVSKISSTTEVVESSNSVPKELNVTFPDSNVTGELDMNSDMLPSSISCDLNHIPEQKLTEISISTGPDNDMTNINTNSVTASLVLKKVTDNIPIKTNTDNINSVSEPCDKNYNNLETEYSSSQSLLFNKSSVLNTENSDVPESELATLMESDSKSLENEIVFKESDSKKIGDSSKVTISISPNTLLNHPVDNLISVSNSKILSDIYSAKVSSVLDKDINATNSAKKSSSESKDLGQNMLNDTLNESTIESSKEKSSDNSENLQSGSHKDSLDTEFKTNQGDDMKLSTLDNSSSESPLLSNATSSLNLAKTASLVTSTHEGLLQDVQKSNLIHEVETGKNSSEELKNDFVKNISSSTEDISEKKIVSDKQFDVNIDMERDSTTVNSVIVKSLDFQDICDSSNPIESEIVSETITRFLDPAVPKCKEVVKKISPLTTPTVCDRSVKFMQEKTLDVSALVEDISSKLLNGELISSIKSIDLPKSGSLNAVLNDSATTNISNYETSRELSSPTVHNASFKHQNSDKRSDETRARSFLSQPSSSKTLISPESIVDEPKFKIPLQKYHSYKSQSPDSASHSHVLMNSFHNIRGSTSKHSYLELLPFKTSLSSISICNNSNLDLMADTSTENLDILSSAKTYECSTVFNELPEPMDFATAETNLKATLSKSLNNMAESEFKLQSFVYDHESILKDPDEIDLSTSQTNEQPLTLTFNSQLSDTVGSKYALPELSHLKMPKPFLPEEGNIVSQNDLNSCSKDLGILGNEAMDVDSLISDSNHFNKNILLEKSSDIITDDNFIGISALETFNAELKNFDSTLNIVNDLNNSMATSSSYQASESSNPTIIDTPNISKSSVPSSVSLLENVTVPSISTSTKKKKFSKLFLEAPNNRIIRKLQLLHDSFKRAENKWRMHVYEKAIMAVRKCNRPIASLEDVQALDGISKKIADKIWEIVQTGQLNKIKDVCSQQREATIRLYSKIWGIGCHAAEQLYQEGHRTVHDLKTKANLSHSHLIALRYFPDLKRQISRAEADKILTAVLKRIFNPFPYVQCDVCSSLRRSKKSTGHIDLLVTLPEGLKNDHKVLPEVVAKLHQDGYLIDDLIRHQENGDQTKYAGIFKLKNDGAKHRRLDITVCSKEEQACALMRLTGPAYFNKAIRQVATKQNMILDDHSLRVKVMNTDNSMVEKKLETPNENAIFEFLGLPFRSPVLRDPDKSKL